MARQLGEDPEKLLARVSSKSVPRQGSDELSAHGLYCSDLRGVRRVRW